MSGSTPQNFFVKGINHYLVVNLTKFLNTDNKPAGGGGSGAEMTSEEDEKPAYCRAETLELPKVMVINRFKVILWPRDCLH